MSPSAVRDVHAVLAGAFKQAQAWGWIDHNPMTLVTRPAVKRVDLDRGEGLVGGKITSLPGELRDEEWTKTRSKRRVAMGPAVVELLYARRVEQAKQALASEVSLSSDAYVFSHEAHRSRPIRPDGVTQRFTRIPLWPPPPVVALAGVAVTAALQTGRDLAIVVGILAAGLTLFGQVLGGPRAVAIGS